MTAFFDNRRSIMTIIINHGTESSTILSYFLEQFWTTILSKWNIQRNYTIRLHTQKTCRIWTKLYKYVCIYMPLRVGEGIVVEVTKGVASSVLIVGMWWRIEKYFQINSAKETSFRWPILIGECFFSSNSRVWSREMLETESTPGGTFWNRKLFCSIGTLSKSKLFCWTGNFL